MTHCCSPAIPLRTLHRPASANQTRLTLRMHRWIFASVRTAANNTAYRLATMPDWHVPDGARTKASSIVEEVCDIRRLQQPEGPRGQASAWPHPDPIGRGERATRSVGRGRFAAPRQHRHRSRRAMRRRRSGNARTGTGSPVRGKSACCNIHGRRARRPVRRRVASSGMVDGRAASTAVTTLTAKRVRGTFCTRRDAMPAERGLHRSPGARSADSPAAIHPPRG